MLMKLLGNDYMHSFVTWVDATVYNVGLFMFNTHVVYMWVNVKEILFVVNLEVAMSKQFESFVIEMFVKPCKLLSRDKFW